MPDHNTDPRRDGAQTRRTERWPSQSPTTPTTARLLKHRVTIQYTAAEKSAVDSLSRTNKTDPPEWAAPFRDLAGLASREIAKRLDLQRLKSLVASHQGR